MQSKTNESILQQILNADNYAGFLNSPVGHSKQIDNLKIKNM